MPPTHGGGLKRKRNTWYHKYGPFPTLQDATDFRDARKVVDRHNTFGLWTTAEGGNARYRFSKCAAHEDCAVKICISSPRVNEEGYNISINDEQHSRVEAVRLQATDGADGGPPAITIETREYARMLVRINPSITPKGIWRAFQSRAEEQGASLRSGRQHGYEGKRMES